MRETDSWWTMKAKRFLESPSTGRQDRVTQQGFLGGFRVEGRGEERREERRRGGDNRGGWRGGRGG
jgi:hypothetical protein